MNKQSVITSLIFISVLAVTGCAKHAQNDAPQDNGGLAASEEPVVIKSRATFLVASDGSLMTPQLSPMANAYAQTSIPVSVVNAANTNVVFDTSAFKVPTISNSVLSFGSIKVTSLIDNNLAVCGTAGTAQCTKAFLRVYTTGTAGAGLWNAAAAYGLPINVIFNSITSPVGLESANAAMVQNLLIAATTHALHLTDFKPTPNYSVSIDFTNAGVGSYATTLVVEYGLQ